MRHSLRVLALTTAVLPASCATLDQKYGDNKVYVETRDLSVKTAHTVVTVTSKAADRMKHYLQEKDVLQTFHDAGEHSETAVLDVIHRAGVKPSPGAAQGAKPGARPGGAGAGTGAGGAGAGTGAAATAGAPGHPTTQGAHSPASIHPPTGIAPKGAPGSAAPANSSSAQVPPQYAGTLRWPLDAGIISSEYGERWGKMHKGIDIAADTGEPVYAIAAGQVIYAGDGLRGYGNVIILRHDTRMTSLYAHNSELKVHEGDHVEQGTLLALLGSTGHSTGPHVHFEIREGDAAVNPHTMLPKTKLAATGPSVTSLADRR